MVQFRVATQALLSFVLVACAKARTLVSGNASLSSERSGSTSFMPRLSLGIALLGLALSQVATAFPTIVPPKESWRTEMGGDCFQPRLYISEEPNDSPQEVWALYVADLSASCKSNGNYTREYKLEPCHQPRLGNIDGIGLDIFATASDCWYTMQNIPNPGCMLHPDYPCPLNPPERRMLPLAKRVCEYGVGSNYSGVGIFPTVAPVYGECRCPWDQTYVPETGKCVGREDRFWHKKSCPVGNPIFVLNGYKRQDQALLGEAVFGAVLSYDTLPKIPSEDPWAVYAPSTPASFGVLWNSSLHKSLASVGTGARTIQVGRGGGTWYSYAKDSNGKYVSDVGVDDKLVPVSTSWRYTDVSGFSQEKYSSAGVMQSLHRGFGGDLVYTYSTSSTPDDIAPRSGLLIKVVDQFGRAIEFHYEQPTEFGLPVRIKKLLDTNGGATEFGYDEAGSLTRITWPDLQVRRFVYENTSLPWALTGLIDEEDRRLGTYSYDTEGRAKSTEQGAGANKYSVTWTNPPRWIITDSYDPVANVVWRDHRWSMPGQTQVTQPNDQVSVYEAAEVNNMPMLSSRSQPAGSGCEASTSELSYDTRGNVTSRLSFGEVGVRNRTCHAYEAGRNFESVRLEGLTEAQACPADLAAHQIPAGVAQRKITTTWHPVWKLETRRAEPKKITTTVYNDQDDPLTTEVSKVSCVPSDTPTLPDGSKIAVVCLRYEQSTNDETGNQGLLATPTGTRKWSYEYNKYGQETKETDPRLKQTTYEYYDTTVFNGDGAEHTMGDLKLMRNALGQTTQYLDYNKRGQVRKIQHPNGSVEQRQYHVRGWLTHVTVTPAGGGVPELTQYEYYPTGLLKQVTQPDGSYASYTWDAAHRLTGVSDTLGNSVTYELDNAGNRTGELYKDPSGQLKKTITRTFDALGRMDSSAGLLH